MTVPGGKGRRDQKGVERERGKSTATFNGSTMSDGEQFQLARAGLARQFSVGTDDRCGQKEKEK